MKKTVFCVATFVCLFTFAESAMAQINEPKFLVVLDPGHGGNDVGAVKNKIKESELVFNIANKIANAIQKTDPNIEVQLTRSQNKYVSLEDRTKILTADLFISLHANSSISTKVQGAEIYFSQDKKNDLKNNSTETVSSIVDDLESIGKNKQSYFISQTVQSQWHLSTSTIRRAPFYVLEKTKYPSVLIEIGFLTNTEEAEKLKTTAYQNQIAETVVNAVIQYKKSLQ